MALIAGAAFLLYSPTPAPQPTAAPVVPSPAPPTQHAPEVEFRLPVNTQTSPAATPGDPALAVTRQILEDVVMRHARDPKDPWAIGHGLLAMGRDMKLADGRAAIPYLFEEYAELQRIGPDMTVRYPRNRGPIRVEPHSDLVLKVLSELGVSPSETFMVENQPMTVGDLYRHSLWRAWVDAQAQTGFDSMNDTPWALQGLSTYAPHGLTWTAQHDHAMSMDLFTDVVAADLHAQTRFMATAMANGEPLKKERQGIFGYTCGGAHLLQGAGYAVARGFGSPTAKQRVVDQIDLLFWRYDVELKILDDLLADPQNAEWAHLLLNQRMKFLGHFLETTHKFAAYGLYTPTAKQQQVLVDARHELSVTVQTVQASGIFNDLPQYKAQTHTYQAYLDYVGDSAHAIRAIDLSTGAATVTF